MPGFTSLGAAPLGATSAPTDIFLKVSQAFVFSITGGATAGERLSQAFVLAVANYPTEEIQDSQSFVTVVTEGATPDLEVSQAWVTVVCRGRVEDPHVRAWTFTLDGHDFYVLRLGDIETLVYDFHSEQWYVYGSHESDLWRAYTGINWQGGNVLSQLYGTNILVGDDGNGSLYFLDPEGSYDDDAVLGDASPRSFPREVYGQVATRSFDFVSCYGVQLGGSIGEMAEAALTTVTLYTSDDQGNTYDDQGTITIANAGYDTRVEWWSLGSFSAPGRLFKISDLGTLHRIDFLEMIEPPGDDDG